MNKRDTVITEEMEKVIREMQEFLASKELSDRMEKVIRASQAEIKRRLQRRA